jgi:hypothetical protein
MSHIKTNGDTPSNPTIYMNQESGSGELYSENEGLTKREAFAMAAMQGILSHSFCGDVDELAVQSARCADALLKELAK